MEIDHELHRKLGVDLFNYVWTLLEKTDRSPKDDDTMIHAAHASRYHWGEVGTPINFARGEWQVSRVYSVLRRCEPAIYHAQRSLDICLQHKINDYDLAYAYEALARAYSISEQWEQVNSFIALARSAGDVIADPADKDWFFKDLSTIAIPGSPED